MTLRYRWLIALLLQVLGTLFTAPLAAQATPAAAAPTHIAAQLLVEGPARPGSTVTLALAMQPGADWHGYWSNPGDAGFGMTLKWSQGDVAGGEAFGQPLYPVPDTLVIAGLMNHVFEHDYAVLVPYRVPSGAQPGTVLPIAVRAQWLACTLQVCVPEEATLQAAVTIAGPAAPTPRDPRFDHWRAQLPAPLGSPARFAADPGTIRLGIPLPRSVPLEQPHVFIADDRVVRYAAPQDFRRQGDLLVVTLARAAGTVPGPAPLSGVLRLNRAGDGLSFAATPGAVAAGGEPLRDTAVPAGASFALLLLAALAGGLLLNVMPCVFPILSLKALSLARAGENAAEARREGLAYTAGVVVACAALGALLLALRAGGSEIGWAFQLQEPGVVVALLLLAAAITANLAGLYEFAVPGFAQGGSPQGAFATGLLAAFVATPCTGPFRAAAMGAALLLPPLPAMALFVALGVGLALPFLAIALIPPLRRALPRPGRWMNTVRRVLAIPMGLTALALAWLSWRLGGATVAALALTGGAVLVALLVLTGRVQRRGLSARTPALAALALGVAAALALPVIAAPPPLAVDGGLIPSRPYSEATLAEARRSGRPVFAWFTADWCLTCKVNEQVAIEREATRDAFARAGVIVLRGDWTRRDPAITRYLAAHGAAGVPLYVWYPASGAEPVVLPQVLTPDTLPQLAAQPAG